MWSFVGAKERARWLWHAIDHHTGRVLAYVVGTRKDAVFLKLKALLARFGITHYYTDKARVYVIFRLAAYGRKAVDAEDRAQAPDVANSSQPLSPQDAVFFPFVPHA